MNRRLYMQSSQVSCVTYGGQSINSICYNGVDVWNNTASFTCTDKIVTTKNTSVQCGNSTTKAVFVPISCLNDFLPTCIKDGYYCMEYMVCCKCRPAGCSDWCQDKSPKYYAACQCIQLAGCVKNNVTICCMGCTQDYLASGTQKSSSSNTALKCLGNQRFGLGYVNNTWGVYIYASNCELTNVQVTLSKIQFTKLEV